MAEIEDLRKEIDATNVLKQKVRALTMALDEAKISYELCLGKRSPFPEVAKAVLKGFFSYGQMFKVLDGDDG